MRQISGILVKGYQIASGLSETSTYPAGTIDLQKPVFARLGLDLSMCYSGTLNVSISPYHFELLAPEYTFPAVEWLDGVRAETFSFSSCIVSIRNRTSNGYVYYPHPETKVGHFHDNSIMEILAPYQPDITYGEKIELSFNSEKVRVFNK